MKKTIVTICTATVVLFSCNSGEKDKATTEKTEVKEEKKTGDTATAPSGIDPKDTAAVMKAWNDFKTPGPMHKWLNEQAGTWTGEASQWMDPSAPPVKSKVSIVNTNILNGLYQESKFTGSMFGAPFEGRSTTGYDNVKKVFVSTWIDNSGSGIVVMTGTWDDATKTLNMKGKQSDPVSGKESDIREELKVVDTNTQVMTMYGTGWDGKETKFMECTLTRKK
jgi:hypothetical protein